MFTVSVKSETHDFQLVVVSGRTTGYLLGRSAILYDTPIQISKSGVGLFRFHFHRNSHPKISIANLSKVLAKFLRQPGTLTSRNATKSALAAA